MENQKDLTYENILSEMLFEYQKLSGFTPLKNSDIYIKLTTFASQIYSLKSNLQWITKQVFPQTATGKYLDYHAQTRGLNRKQASKSSGVLTFFVSEPAKDHIIIPEGTVCFSPLNPNIKFSTTAQAIIKQGEKEADAFAVSTKPGIETNLRSNTISNISNPPEYVEAVTNKNNFEGGLSEESDESLRSRLLNSFKNISNGCNCAYYHNIVMNYDGVSSVNVIPRNRGRGSVDIVVSTTKKDDSLIKKINEDLSAQKEINVDIAVSEAKIKEINIDVNLEIDNTFYHKTVCEKTKEIIKEYILNLGVYDPLTIAALGSKIFDIPGIKNYTFNNPTKDVFINKDEIIKAGNITVSC